MKFGGNDYVYLSKNKISKATKLRNVQLFPIEEVKENDSMIPVKQEQKDVQKQKEKSEEENEEEMLKEIKAFENEDKLKEEIEDLKEELNTNCSKRNKKRKISFEKDNDDDINERLSLSVESICDHELNRSYSDGLNINFEEEFVEAKKDEVKFQKVVDTNMLSIKFEFLKTQIPFATGDPQYCSKCKAILNSLSVLEEKGNVFIWKCEFCLTVNELAIEKEEIPKEPCVDFFVESCNQANKSSFNYTDNQSLIYCFDISGSMCVTYPLDKKLKIKGSRVDSMYKEMMKWSDGSDQFYETNQKNITYVSRLQCLQGAIEENINSLVKNAPNMKVGFVTFANSVMAYGDCLKDPITIEGDNLNNKDYISKIGEENTSLLTSPIKASQEKLIKSLYSFEESGQTALGPAMLLSISLIEKAALGSRIILCTDGITNLGLGSIPDVSNANDIKKAKEYFGKLGTMAKEKGIVVSLITFQDEESKIEVLIEMIEKTGGEIIRVNPKQIIEDFSNLLSNEIVATHVTLQIKLHKVLSFRNESDENIKENGSTLVKSIGNATKETEIYVEYMFKKSAELAKYDDIDIDKLKTVPFQSIIEYTTPSGDRCIRVITNHKKISNEKEEVAKQSNYDIISTNAIQKTAHIAQKGNLREAQAEAYAWKKFIKDNSHDNNQTQFTYQAYANQMHDFNTEMNKLNQQPKASEEYEAHLRSDDMNAKLYSMKNISHNYQGKGLFKTDQNLD